MMTAKAGAFYTPGATATVGTENLHVKYSTAVAGLTSKAATTATTNSINQGRVVGIYRMDDRTAWDTFISDVANIVTSLTDTDLTISKETTPLVLSEENYNLALQTTTSTPINDLVGGLLGTTTGTVAKATVEAVTGLTNGEAAVFNPWFKNMKAWQDTKLQAITLKFDFKMGQYGLWNAKTEVLLPTLALLVTALPSELNQTTMTGPFYGAMEMLGRFLSESASAVADAVASSTTSSLSAISKALLEVAAGSSYMVTLGKTVAVQYAVVTACNFSFSTEVDQHNFPIASSISLTFEGILPPALNTSTAMPYALRFGTYN
jgi:hypothetical protein